MAHLGAWGAAWLDTTPELTVRAELLAAGGPALWERFMAELRATHLHSSPAPADGVLAELTAAYQAAVADTATG
ncbi:hypothetical protein Q3A91_05555 [Nocardia mangyaensis]|nr:hypothetical protein [Nocardia mangyaensis]MDO3646426.1 hypothetical protein [Nocardia mangyaensis]